MAQRTNSNLPQLDEATIAAVIAQICGALGLDPTRPPLHLTEDQTSSVLDVTAGTLAVWRSAKRYPLAYARIGRKIRYPLRGVAEFYVSRMEAR